VGIKRVLASAHHRSVNDDTLGNLVTPCSGADSNCKGFVEKSETHVWKDHFGESIFSAAGQPTTGVPEGRCFFWWTWHWLDSHCFRRGVPRRGVIKCSMPNDLQRMLTNRQVSRGSSKFAWLDRCDT
jgi:hypothetical protein